VLFRNAIFAVSTLVTFVSGAAMYSGSVYIPLFMQGVLGFSATNSGLVMMPMMLSLVAGSLVSGQLISRTGKYKWNCVAGFAVATGGLYLLSTMDAHSSRVAGMGGMAVLGAGLGIAFTLLVLSAQNAVPYSMMGVTTSINQFSRSVGGTIDVAVMGSLLTKRLESELATGLPTEVTQRAPSPLLEVLKNSRLLLDRNALQRVHNEGFVPVFGSDADRLFNAAVASMKDGLATAITEVFLKEVPLRTTYEMLSDFETASEPESAVAAGTSISAPASPPLRGTQERASTPLGKP
jgi:hypothetical protein